MPNMRMTKTPCPRRTRNVATRTLKRVVELYRRNGAGWRGAACGSMPCVSGCPVNILCSEFIRRSPSATLRARIRLLRSPLPATSAAVSAAGMQCESGCVRGIMGEPVGIGRLERFVADWHNAHATVATITAPKNGHKVASIGSGPAGLTCAGDLAKLGYDVTIYEALHLAGGVLVYGIPEFHLPSPSKKRSR